MKAMKQDAKIDRNFLLWGVVTAALVLYFAVRILLPNYSYELNGDMVLSVGESIVLYEPMQLPAGVYRVELSFAADSETLDPIAFATVQDTTVRTDALLTNGEHLYAGMTATSFTFWLYEQADELQVRVDTGDICALTVSGCTVTETDGLWTRYLTITLALSAVALGLLILYRRGSENCFVRDTRAVLLCEGVIVLLAVMPYLYGESTFTGIDLTYHMQRIEGIADGFFSGQIPVRIEPEWLYGRGYAAAIFYCDLLLYFPAILRLLGFTVVEAYNAYCITLTVLTAGISYGCFRRIFRDRQVGCLCSAMYTLSVFRIYKLFMTCDIGESSAFAFLPLILYGLWRAFTEDSGERSYRTVWIPIAFGYAGLIQTHALTCLITAELTVLICLICIRKVFRPQTFRQLAQGALAAMAMGAWFLVPFLDYYFTQEMHVKAWGGQSIQERGLTLAHLLFQFWGSGEYTPGTETGIYHTYPVGVGLILVLGLAGCCYLWGSGKLKACGMRIASLARVVSCVGVLLLWMSTRLFPWDAISGLSEITATMVGSLEFPNRVLGWGTALLVTACGVWLYWCRARSRSGFRISAVLIAGGLLTSSVYLMEAATLDGDRYAIYNEEGMGFGFISDGEFLLEGTDTSVLTFAKSASPGENVSVTSYEKDYLVVTLECTNTGTDDSYVDIPLTYYRDYGTEDLDTGESLETVAGDNNTVRVLLPAGYSGRLEVRFRSPWYWRAAEAVSAAAILFVLWNILRKRKQENGGKETFLEI